MKVLLVNPHIFSGGAERVVISTARWLNKLGTRCDVLTLSLRTEAVKDASGVHFILPQKRIPYTHNVAVLGTAKKAILELHSLYLSINSLMDDYDIFNPHNFPANWAFGLAKTRDESRVVWTCHDVFDVHGSMRVLFERNKALQGLLKVLSTFDRNAVIRSIDAIVTVSAMYAKKVAQAYGQQPYIIPPAVETENYVNGDGELFRDRYNLSDNFLIVHVGDLIPRKGQEISIGAIAVLRDYIPSVRLALIGEGPDLQRLRKLALDLNIEESIIFTGKIGDSDLRNAYTAADVNVLPSTLESFGLTPIEALASGTASIVSRDAGVSEYLNAYGIGYVLPERTSRELAKLILHVYKNRDEADAKVEKAQGILREKFSWDNHVRKLLEVFKTVA